MGQTDERSKWMEWRVPGACCGTPAARTCRRERAGAAQTPAHGNTRTTQSMSTRPDRVNHSAVSLHWWAIRVMQLQRAQCAGAGGNHTTADKQREKRTAEEQARRPQQQATSNRTRTAATSWKDSASSNRCSLRRQLCDGEPPSYCAQIGVRQRERDQKLSMMMRENVASSNTQLDEESTLPADERGIDAEQQLKRTRREQSAAAHGIPAR